VLGPSSHSGAAPARDDAAAAAAAPAAPRRLQASNTAPSWVSTTGAGSAADSAPPDGTVIVYTATATDPDPSYFPGGQLTWSLVSATPSNGGSLFSVATNNGSIIVVGSLSGLAGSVFTLTLRVTDGLGATATPDCVVTVRVQPSYCITNPLGRYVRIRKTTSQSYTQVAEIEVFGPDGSTNFARNKPARAGMTYYTSNCFGFGAPSGYCEASLVTNGAYNDYAMTGTPVATFMRRARVGARVDGCRPSARPCVQSVRGCWNVPVPRQCFVKGAARRLMLSPACRPASFCAQRCH
jgi:hypothetical protein